jgi:phage terminase small subunit
MSKLEINRGVFVEEYLKTGQGKQSAIKAGYPAKTAQQNAVALLKKDKFVVDAIAKARGAVVAAGTYNLQMAMKEADDAIKFARKTENANAYVKAVELKTKLNGLLVEKHDHRVAGFAVVVGGINFSKRDGEDDDGGDLFE